MTLDILGYTQEQIKQLLLNDNDTSTKELERIGKQLSTEDLLHLLQRQKNLLPHRLSALLMGVSENAFSGLLSNINENVLAQLFLCIHEEPLLHQLTIFGNATEKSLNERIQKIEGCLSEIEAIDHSNLTTNELDTLYLSIHAIEDEVESLKTGLQNALRLAWQSDRQQLVEQFSHLKEVTERLHGQMLGRQRNEGIPATGLYLRLEQKLSSIYDNRLKESDPSIEALAVLGIVYAEEFQEMGLIAKGKQDHTLQQVQQGLDRLGLHTVADIKANRIFSAHGLKEYIKQASKFLRL